MDTISALMKPRWKSVWITPAASGAVAPPGMVQALASLGPAVRYVDRPSAVNPARASWAQARLAQAQGGQHLGGVLLLELGQLGLGLGVEEDRLGRARPMRPERSLEHLVGQLETRPC